MCGWVRDCLWAPTHPLWGPTMEGVPRGLLPPKLLRGAAQCGHQWAGTCLLCWPSGPRGLLPPARACLVCAPPEAATLEQVDGPNPCAHCNVANWIYVVMQQSLFYLPFKVYHLLFSCACLFDHTVSFCAKQLQLPMQSNTTNSNCGE